jgi:4-amino-4-deoxy-L-arabinose transferase-like glycosyltransferase
MEKASMKKILSTNYYLLSTNTRDWIQKNRLEFIVLVAILLIGTFMRLYRIDEYMTFLGDEGRDVIVVRRLLVDFDPILVGPGTSIGDMYLGPLYYYMMAPALLLANYSPVGPAVMIALLGVVTVFFVWYIGREWFGKIAAPISAFLYAIAPVVIIYSRSSWNPNIMPFFALLTIYSLWRIWQRRQYKWLIVTGVAMAFVLQSHYLGLLLIPTIGVFWGLTLIGVIRGIGDVRDNNRLSTIYQLLSTKFFRLSLIAFLLFAFLMSPLFLFDARHGWRNYESMRRFFTQRQTTVSARPWTALPKLGEIADEVTTNLVVGKAELIGDLVAIPLMLLSTAILMFVYIKSRSRESTQEKIWLKALFLVLVWMAVAFVGLGVYKQEIYDHYYGFFFAAPFLLLGGITEATLQYSKRISFLGFLLVGIFLYVLISANLHKNPLKYPPNRQLQRTIEVANKMVEEAGDKKFNIAVIAERNYEGAYQYFLEKENANFVMIDPQRADETITEQLFVVCELPKEKCDPTHNDKAEVANFGWSKIEQEWSVSGVTLFKLVHTQ